MRPSYAGPGSASSRWKPTQDPGKTSPSSNTGANRQTGTDVNSTTTKETNTQNQQQSTNEEDKE